MHRVVVILIVGLTRRQIGADTPNLSALAEQGFELPPREALMRAACVPLPQPGGPNRTMV